MALPTEFNTITVVMDYADSAGVTPLTGSKVEFSPAGDIFLKALISDVTIFPGVITVPLTSGHGSTVLPYTNDPDITPTFTYRVKETLLSASGSITRNYNVEVPVGLGAGPVNLADLAPVGVTTVGTNYLTRGVADGLYAPAGTTGTGGDGREVALRTASGFIQWQYVGDSTWTNLVALSTLTGAPGAAGAAGAAGPAGAAGAAGVAGATGPQGASPLTYIHWNFTSSVWEMWNGTAYVAVPATKPTGCAVVIVGGPATYAGPRWTGVDYFQELTEA